ncbi:MAG: DUF2889 domain-containing protein [Spirochaetes bacterium]|nr:DUF2889 domain-containing protein [Spirochaetota bacterium]
MKNKKVFTRSIEVSCYEDGDNSIVVEGEIKDTRLCPYYLVTGERKEPGILHNMKITMHVSGSNLIISNIKVDMIHYPREECVEVNNNIYKLNGLSITKGFTKAVKDTIGGINGCTHVTNCILAMAPAAVQGFWANKAQKPVTKEFANQGSMSHYLIDTCYVWRNNGPMIQKLSEAINKIDKNK